MAITRGLFDSGIVSTGTSVTATFPSDVTTGSLIVVACWKLELVGTNPFVVGTVRR